jgi:hypothetical protein
MIFSEREYAFQSKLDDCMEKMFKNHFPDVPYAEATEKFADIAAAWSVYGGLTGGLPEYDMEYLNQFDDPLEMLTMKWREKSLWPDVGIEVDCAIEQLRAGQAELHNGQNQQCQQMG